MVRYTFPDPTCRRYTPYHQTPAHPSAGMEVINHLRSLRTGALRRSSGMTAPLPHNSPQNHCKELCWCSRPGSAPSCSIPSMATETVSFLCKQLHRRFWNAFVQIHLRSGLFLSAACPQRERLPIQRTAHFFPSFSHHSSHFP